MTHSDGTTPRHPAHGCARLLDAGELIIAPGIFDGITAHLVRLMGFRAGDLTGPASRPPGSACPTSGWSPAEMVERARMIAGVLGGDQPLIADADTGLRRRRSTWSAPCAPTSRPASAAIQLEDQAFPKRCGHLAGKEVVARGRVRNHARRRPRLPHRRAASS